MLWTILSILVVLVCLAGIGMVIVRKFPQLALIDTEALPMERDLKRKKQIAEEKVNRVMSAFGGKFAEVARAVFNWLRARFRGAYRRLRELERSMQPQRPPSRAEAERVVPNLKAKAEAFIKEEQYGDAEKCYIEILRQDRKDVDAYWGLASVLSLAKRDGEAAEIFSYLSKLLRRQAGCTHDDAAIAPSDRPCPANADIHADLGSVFVDLGIVRRNADDQLGAKAALESAVAFGGDNPRYLDLLLEACILTGDKSRARRVYERLTQANPQNQKLSALAERIDAMPETEGPKRGKAK